MEFNWQEIPYITITRCTKIHGYKGTAEKILALKQIFLNSPSKECLLWLFVRHLDERAFP